MKDSKIIITIAIISIVTIACRPKENIEKSNYLGDEKTGLKIFKSDTADFETYELKIADTLSYCKWIKTGTDSIFEFYTINNVKEGPQVLKVGEFTMVRTFYKQGRPIVVENYYRNSANRLDSVYAFECVKSERNGEYDAYPIGKIIYNNGILDTLKSTYYLSNYDKPYANPDKQSGTVIKLFPHNKFCYVVKGELDDQNKPLNPSYGDGLSGDKMLILPPNQEYEGLSLFEGTFNYCDKNYNEFVCSKIIPVYFPMYYMNRELYNTLF